MAINRTFCPFLFIIKRMKRIIISLSLLAVTALPCLTGCQVKPKQQVFYDENYTLYKDISYGNHYRHRYDLCIPKENQKQNGLLLHIHGGGWVAGDKDGYWENLSNEATNYGFTIAAMNYRYANDKNVHYQEILDDIYNCLLSIKQIGQDHGLDFKKLITDGGSAGGHLSLLYSYKMKDKSPIKPVAAISYSGITDFLDPNFYNQEDLNMRKNVCNLLEKASGETLKDGISEEEKPTLIDVSPLYHVDEDTVPTLFAHGTLDDVVPLTNATSLKEKLDEYHVKNDLIVFPNSGHGLENDPTASELVNQKVKKYFSYL